MFVSNINEFEPDEAYEVNMVKTAQDVEITDSNKRTFIFKNCSFNNVTFQ